MPEYKVSFDNWTWQLSSFLFLTWSLTRTATLASRAAMLNRKPTARRQRRRSNGSKPRRCSAPTVLGPPRVQLTLFPSNEDIPSRLCSTPQPLPIVVPVAHSVDSGVTWLKSQRAYAQQLAPGQSSYQLWPGYGNCLDGGSLTSGSQVRGFLVVCLPWRPCVTGISLTFKHASPCLDCENEG